MGQKASECGKKLLIWFKGDLLPIIPVPSALVFQSASYRSRAQPNRFVGPHFIDDPTLKYSDGRIVLRRKTEKPVVGFCGYAGVKPSKVIYSFATSITRNLSSVLGRSNYETDVVLPATLLRARALKILSNSSLVDANFIIRDKYRAGFKQKSHQMEGIASEFFRNVYETDYTLCVRGYGNWSVRFYETLACGRIPLFIDTDSVLPFETEIDWKKVCVWVNKNDLPYIAEKLADFHSEITADDFWDLQRKCRAIWEERLTMRGFMSHLSEYFNSNT
jgi:hypothetical protein